MRAVNVAAHPLVVAVAMGFLSPAALEEPAEPSSRAELVAAGDTDALVEALDEHAPSAEDFARVELLWYSVSGL